MKFYKLKSSLIQRLNVNIQSTELNYGADEEKLLFYFILFHQTCFCSALVGVSESFDHLTFIIDIREF